MIDSRSHRRKYRINTRACTVMTALFCVGLALAPQIAHAKKKGVWSVVRTADPITGRQTCAVSALDRLGGMRFAQVGILYAVVENNPEAGVLVGVSSGGRWRMPVGDIVWRVDDRPHRTLRAIDNPKVRASGSGSPIEAAAARRDNAVPDTAATSSPDTASSDASAFAETYARTVTAAMDQQSAAVAALTATATMASGETARSMLAEMRAGKSLLFRQEAATPLYGLPSSNVYAIGQDTNKGRKPIPLDQSFHDGLAACGIGVP